MSLENTGIWAAGVWATTVWADGVWYEQGDPVGTDAVGGSSGLFFFMLPNWD